MNNIKVFYREKKKKPSYKILNQDFL